MNVPNVSKVIGNVKNNKKERIKVLTMLNAITVVSAAPKLANLIDCIR